ncbi:MAG: ATP-binding protein [Leucobacter sp.]
MCPRRSSAEPGRAERSARRFLLGAALILATIALAAFIVPLLLSVPPRVTGAISWRPTALGAAVLIGLLLRELRGAWAMLAIGIAAATLPMLLAQRFDLAALATLSQTLLVCLVLGFVGTVMLRLSRSADAAGARRERAAAAAAAAAGAGAARARAAALVHDEVLSTLNLAASPHLADSLDPQAGLRLAEQAERAKRLLAEASGEETPSIVAALRDEVAALDPEAGFAVVGGGAEINGVGRGNARGAASHGLVEVPVAAQPILLGAVRQALRNSVLHAGPRAMRRVAVEHGPTRLRITVIDDGVGFDPAQVPGRRLGLRTSAGAVRSAGGEVVVRSEVGGGTRVSVDWPGGGAGAAASEPSVVSRPSEPTPSAPAAAGGNPRSLSEYPALPVSGESARLGDAPLVRTGVAIAAIAFTASQAALAAAAARTASSGWIPPLVLALLFASALLLQHRYETRLDGRRTALVLALVGGATTVGLLGAPFEVGDLWFAGAAAFLLTALAFRGRPGAAAAGGLLLSALLVISGVANGAPPLMIAAVSIRPLGVTCFAVALALSVTALLRRIARELAATEAESARESWERSAREELAEQADEVRVLVDDALGEIALGRALSAPERARAKALEGHLRDRIRAGRLAVEPLMTAAMRARARGVDVLLLDDLDGDLPDGFDMDRAAIRLAAACDDAVGRVTVRVLPAGRSTVVSLVVDGAPVDLPQDREARSR